MYSEIDGLMVIESEIAAPQLIERVLMAGAVHGMAYREKLLGDPGLEDFHARTIALYVRGEWSLLALAWNFKRMAVMAV